MRVRTGTGVYTIARSAILLATLAAAVPQLLGQVAMTSGQTYSFSASGIYQCTGSGLFPTCYVGIGTFTIDVPQGANRLDVRVTLDPSSFEVIGSIAQGSTMNHTDGGGYAGSSVMGVFTQGKSFQYSLTTASTGGLVLTPGTWVMGLDMYPVSVMSTYSASGTIVATVSAGPTTAAQLFPHLADGGEWQTEFWLTNETTGRVTAQILFHLDGGTQGLPIEGLGTTAEIDGISIPANGLVLYRTTGLVSSPVTSGWAELVSSAPLSGQAVFRRHAGDGKYYEGAVPLVTPSRGGFTIPFDGTSFTDGTPFYSGLAIANANSTVAAAVTCSAYRGADGAQLGVGLQLASLAPSAHVAAILQWTPPTQSVLGTERGLLVCTSTAEIGVLGLRAFGAYAITSLPVTMH